LFVQVLMCEIACSVCVCMLRDGNARVSEGGCLGGRSNSTVSMGHTCQRNLHKRQRFAGAFLHVAADATVTPKADGIEGCQTRQWGCQATKEGAKPLPLGHVPHASKCCQGGAVCRGYHRLHANLDAQPPLEGRRLLWSRTAPICLLWSRMRKAHRHATS